ncbi:hypothetical protein I302_104488 [Kwoniella bestiolae CBS 10118]|uniref:Uncharacterized protein n=1 Tax=Kwoniella bestiolae CBS 10118 TaxID=1296100 RepID=A0A1B9GBD8_9TREE|nr:hypothetical protein I302_03194 [Kwoniella bestiolae CBS 10118]OCF28335.1 hypothetical protein I302_03194 [Kwoniella bestiolae CBS 10118]
MPPTIDANDNSLEGNAFRAMREDSVLPRVEDEESPSDEADIGVSDRSTDVHEKLAQVIESKKNFGGSMKKLNSEYETQLRRATSQKINGEVITLLALRLVELDPSSSEGMKYELQEIAAALLDEVDRAHTGKMGVELNEGVDTYLMDTKRERWDRERDERLFNSEGIVGVLQGRVELLEDARSKGIEQQAGEDISLISQFDFGDEGASLKSEEVDDSEKTDSHIDKLEELENGCTKLNDKVNRLENA